MTSKKFEDIVKVSPKGQIVIPKDIRKKFGVSPGQKLLIMSKEKEILIKKLDMPSIEDISEKLEKVAKEKGIDIDKLLDEAIQWARKPK